MENREIPKDEVLANYTMKLMDKARDHPKLTPRLLRTRLELKLGLRTDSLNLKPQREIIKSTIIAWWFDNADLKKHGIDLSSYSKKETSNIVKKSTPSTLPETISSGSATKNSAENTYQRLLKVASAAGKTPRILQGLKALNSDEERVVELRKRLRDLNLKFSDIPTKEEVIRIEKEAQLSRDMEDLSGNCIIEGSRKRGSEALPQPRNDHRPPKSIKVVDGEEEAEFI